jgi:hypothetical protein
MRLLLAFFFFDCRFPRCRRHRYAAFRPRSAPPPPRRHAVSAFAAAAAAIRQLIFCRHY